MTIKKLVFTHGREVFAIEICNHVITYTDRRNPNPIQFMPKDPEIRRKVIFSRNKIPKYILDLIDDANSGRNLAEYQACKTDEELVPIVIRDAKIKGCLLQKRMDID